MIQDMGNQGFNWFIGLVEKIDGDPELLGRVKVRVFNVYDENYPTEDLPWAHILMPATSNGLNGVSDTPNISVGTRVVGFFADGLGRRLPIVMGSLLFNTEDDSKSNKHSLSFLARGKNVIEKIPIGPEDPKSPYATKYPFNRVIQTKSGHTIELDDTEGEERIHIYHRAGTYIEIDKEGSMVIASVKDSHDITGGDKSIYIKGNARIQVDGKLDAVIKGETNIISESDINLSSKKKINLSAVGGISLKSGKEIAVSGPGGIVVSEGSVTAFGAISSGTGVTGTFTSPSGQTIHVQKGQVTNIT
jgi:hypothetical protein